MKEVKGEQARSEGERDRERVRVGLMGAVGVFECRRVPSHWGRSSGAGNGAAFLQKLQQGLVGP